MNPSPAGVECPMVINLERKGNKPIPRDFSGKDEDRTNPPQLCTVNTSKPQPFFPFRDVRFRTSGAYFSHEIVSRSSSLFTHWKMNWRRKRGIRLTVGRLFHVISFPAGDGRSTTRTPSKQSLKQEVILARSKGKHPHQRKPAGCNDEPTPGDRKSI